MGFHVMAGWRGGLSRRGKFANGLLLAALTLPVPTVAQSDGSPRAGVAGGSEAAVGSKSVGETATQGVRSEESLARFEALLQRRPLHAAAFAGLVDHYTERGKLGDLVGEYQAKVAALPDDVPLKIVLARLQLRAGDPAAAAKTLETVGGLRDEMARHGLELMLFQAEVRQRGGDDAGAERVLEEAQRQAVSVSDRTKVGEALADLRLRQGRKDDAVKVFELLAAEFPDNYTHQKRMAESLSQRGLHEAAVSLCKATLPLVREEADRRCEVLRQLGMSLEKLSRGEEAIAAYIEAIGLLASDHWLMQELHERVVTLYRAANRMDELATYCRDQIARAPEQRSFRTLLADVLATMGKTDEAKGVLAEAVERFPTDSGLSQKRVQLLEKLGDIDGASSEFQRAIAGSPEDHELYVDYGQFLANNRRTDAARNQWRHVLGTRISDAGLAMRLAGLFEACGLVDDAAEAYERAISVNPKLGEAYTALSSLHRARNEPEKADGVLDRMWEASKDDAGALTALAAALHNAGKIDRALEVISRACELQPDQTRLQEARSDLLVQAGRLEDALAVRRGAIDRYTNPIQQAEAVATLVSMHATAGTLGALKEREVARQATGKGDAVALLILAEAADAERKLTEVRMHIDAMLALDPGNELALQKLARVQDAVSDIDGATATYRRLIERFPARARRYYEATVDLKLRFNDRGGAIETLEALAKLDPASAATQSAVAEQLVRMGEWDRALGYFGTALKLQPDRHETRLGMGKALVATGRLEEALREFRTLASQRSDTDRAVEGLALMYDTASQLGKVEDVVDELQNRLETEPSNTTLARVLASLLVREMEYARAMTTLDLASRHSPNDPGLLLDRGDILRRLAKFNEAVDAYQGVLRAPQVDRDYVLGELGKAWFESGQLDQAKRVWRQIQNRLYSGSLLKNNGMLDDAVAVFEEGLRLKPDDSALHRNLIETFESAGKIPEALNAARRLLDLEPGNAMNVERLANAYLRTGDRAGAAQVAARLFSSGVARDASSVRGGQSYGNYAWARYAAAYSGSVFGAAYGYSGGRTNIERGTEFFMRNGLMTELEQVLREQIAAQPDNAVLKDLTANLMIGELGKPDEALALLRELETAVFPIEAQKWLGQCGQRDWMRVRQYNLIAAKPALRDKTLGALSAKRGADLSRDELLQLGAIHRSMGNNDKAAEVLTRAVESGADDILALSMLSDLLVASEKFTLAEPHTRRLIGLLGESRQRMHDETVDRVRREFVRTLPIELQLRVTDAFISDIAEKWTLGSSWSYYTESQARVAGYLQAQLTLATILAETGRIDDAAALWTSIGPGDRPDADRWIQLGDAAQQHKRSDLAFDFYRRAMGAARRVLGDPLLQQVYLSSATQRSWYGEGNTIDGAFNGIVDTFAKHDALIDLYDFLRDTDQLQRARRLAEQYNLDEKLLPILRQRVERAAAAFQGAGRDDPYGASVAYFAEVCKYAEVLDRTGDWPGAQVVYEEYLRAFPDELELLRVLSEVAEKRQKLPEAIAWQKKVLECQLRLGQNSRRWMTRQLALTPSDPGVLAATGNADRYSYGSRWARNWWGYGSRDFANRSESWMRLAQLQLGSGNTIAAADAMQKCAAEAGPRRAETFQRIMDVIQKRQLVGPMLPVLRSLAVMDSGNERVQLAFAQSLEAQGRRDLALEVCERLLRRGVSDLGTLSEVRRQIEVLKPSDVSGETTVASLEAEAAADPDNMKLQVRLAKAYYYSLRIDRARPLLEEIAVKAPYLDEARELLTEVYTVLGESEQLIESLKARIARAKDDNARRELRRRLMEEYLAAGRDDEAVATAKELGDPRNPASYLEIGALLHYFGRHEEATECYRQSTKNTRANPWGEGRDRSILARSLVLRGDVNGAADELLQGISASANQQTQYSGNAMYGTGNPFTPVAQLLALYPGFAEAVYSRVEAKYKAAPSDPAAAKLMMHLHGVLGRADKAEAILEALAKNSAADQAVANRLIQSARARKDYARAIELATRFIEQSPKPQLAAGVPAQYAAYSMLQSPRVQMLLTLGDLLWESGEKDRAFESYKQIIDDKVDETRQVYAAICLGRGRLDEARGLIEGALAAQTVKSAQLLATGALVACAEGDTAKAFEYLKSAASSSEQPVNQFGEQTASPLVQLRLLAQATGREKEFVAYVEDRIKKTPEVWDSYAALVELHMSLGRPSEALAVLDRAAAIGSLERDALLMRHALTRQSGDADRSISILERLIALSDSDATGDEGLYESAAFRAELGALLWSRGEKDRALQAWTERIRSDDARDQLSLASLLDRYGEQDRAHAAVTRAVALEPDGTNGRILAARIAWERSDLRSLLEHVHASFVRGATGTNDGGYGERSDWSGAPRFAVWAAALAASPEVSALIGGSGGTEKRDDRGLTLAALTGDWSRVEAAMRTRLEKDRSVDPLAWRIWSEAMVRVNNPAELARGLEMQRRLRRTTLADYESRLKLVLAGNQVRDAAAGTRQVPPGGFVQQGQGSTAYPGRGSRYFNSYGGSGEAADVLPLLYIRQGDLKRAERLYLVGSDTSDHEYRGGLLARLPLLAKLMARQGRHDRALELLRLGMTLSTTADGYRSYDGGSDSLAQYASMLADSGDIEAAIGLLIRGARLSSDPDEQMSQDAADSETGYGWTRRSGADSQLYDLLLQSGRFEGTVATLVEQSKQDPADAALAYLIADLLTRGERWMQLGQFIKDREKSQSDLRLMFLSVRAFCEQGQWDEALASLEQVKRLAATRPGRWQVFEAYIRMMKGDREGATAAVASLHDERSTREFMGGPTWRAAASVVSVAGSAAQATEVLSRHIQNGELPAYDHELLARMLAANGDWGASAHLALQRLWQEQGQLGPSNAWWRTITDLGAAAARSGVSLRFDGARPEDDAMLKLISGDPSGALGSFGSIASKPDASLDALRGLVAAALLSGDDNAALAANTRLLEWVGARRDHGWYKQPAPTVQWMAQVALASAPGTSSTQLTYGGVTQALNQVIGTLATTVGTVTYEELWQDHTLLQRFLVARTGNVNDLESLIREQNKRLFPYSASEDGNEYGTFARYSQAVSRRRANLNMSSAEISDVGAQARRALYMAGRFEALATVYDTLGKRVRRDEEGWVIESLYAAGRDGDARRVLRERAAETLVELDANDAPDLGRAEMQRLRWSSDQMDMHEAESFLSTLAGVATVRDIEDGDDASGWYGGWWNSGAFNLVFGAVLDVEIEQQLLARERRIGPGWGGTSTLRTICELHRVRRDPAAVIRTIERACEPAQMLGEPSLWAYLWACRKTEDWGRISALVELAAKRYPSLAPRLAPYQLAKIRALGRTQEAEALEAELLSKRVIQRPTRLNLPSLLTGNGAGESVYDDRFRRYFGVDAGRQYSQDFNSLTGYMTYQREALIQNPATEQRLKAMLGVKFTSDWDRGGRGIEAMITAYELYGLFEDAARLRQIAEGEAATAGERVQQMLGRAANLLDAGRGEAAASVSREAERVVLEELKLDAGSSIRSTLSTIYWSKAYGRDAAKTLEALSKHQSGPYDFGVYDLKVRCLHELGRFPEAYESWNKLVAVRGMDRASPRQSLYAGIAAVQSGHKEVGRALCRRALYLEPTGPLAREALALINEQP